MIDETLFEAEEKMDKAVEVAKEDFATIRTGRANAGDVHQGHVDYYGSPTPLQQLASFNVTEARTILVSPFDKSSLGASRRRCATPTSGVNPTNDGNVIRIVLPALTRGAPQGLRQARQDQGRGRAHLGAQHPPPRQGGARPHRQGRRGRRGRGRARRRSSSALRRSTSTSSTTCSRPRRASCSRSDDDRQTSTDRRHRGRPAPVATSRSRSSSGVALLGAVGASLFIRKEAFVVVARPRGRRRRSGSWRRRSRAADIHLPLLPLLVGTVGILVSAYTGRPGGAVRRRSC